MPARNNFIFKIMEWGSGMKRVKYSLLNFIFLEVKATFPNAAKKIPEHKENQKEMKTGKYLTQTL